MCTEKTIVKRPWKRASLWLMFLGPFFFLSYGLANSLAEQQANVGSFVFDWEYGIPFIAWTIIPYWVIDLLYGVSLYVCATKRELDAHARRLLTVQIIAIVCFMLFPLTFSFERPVADGVYGLLFDTLNGFDKPFNQAPSLHIALLVVLWVLYVKHLPRLLVWPFHILSILIGISVLTTYQHHFIDVPTGLLLGWFSVWLWPEQGRSPLALTTQQITKQRQKVALYYLGGSAVLSLLAFWIGGVALWLLWPAISLFLVAGNYVLFGAAGFQKGSHGGITQATKWLLFPYLLAARINARIWTRNEPAQNHIIDSVWLGRFPTKQTINNNNITAIIDLSAEFQALDHEVDWHAIPCLDLITLQVQELIQAARMIEQKLTAGPVLVSCALGYSRSAMVIVFWLTITNRVADLAAAIKLVMQARPALVLNDEDRLALQAAIDEHEIIGQ